MSYPTSIEMETIQQWIRTKMDPKAIELDLSKKGYDADFITAQLKEYKRLLNSKRQFNGFACLAIGALLGFLSCVLTLINPVPELYNLILFGLTSISILVVFAGLYFIFE